MYEQKIKRLKTLFGVILATHGDEETVQALKLAIRVLEALEEYEKEANYDTRSTKEHSGKTESSKRTD